MCPFFSSRYRRRFWSVVLCAVLSLGLAIAQPAALYAQTPQQSLEQGQQAYRSGQYSSAAQALQTALDQYIQHGDHLSQAQTLNFLAQTYRQLQDYGAAQSAIAQSLAVLDTLGDRPQLQAQALMIQGDLWSLQGQHHAAQATLAQAETLYHQAGDTEGVQGSRLNQAQALLSLGNYRRACNLLLGGFGTVENCDQLATLSPQGFEQWLNQLSVQVQTPTAAQVLTGLANSFVYTGALDRSRQLLQLALNRFEQWQQPGAIAATHAALGNLARRLNDRETALSHYQAAADVLQPFAPSLIRSEAQINQLGLLLQAEADETATMAIAPLVTTIHTELGAIAPSHGQLLAQVQLARQRLNQSNPPVADLAQDLTQTVQAAQTLGDRLIESYALGLLGTAYEQAQQYRSALTVTQQALEIAQLQQIPELVYQWEWQQTRLLEQQGQVKAAIAANQRSVKALEKLEYDLVSSNRESQFSFQEQVEPIYRNLISLLTLPETSDATHPEANLRQAMAVMENLQVAELNDFFRAACITANAVDVENQPDAALIYPMLLRDRLVTIMSLPGEPLTLHTTPVSAAEVIQVGRRFMRLLISQRHETGIVKTSQQLYDWLIRPLAPELTASGVDTLVFIPDGYLRRIPIAALHDGDHYLVEDYSVAITPGLRLLASQRLEQVDLNPFVAGLSDARPGFAAIPGVQAEVDQISSGFPGSKTLFNETFTQTSLLETLATESYPVVHLATHGVFGSKPEDTFLLAWDERINATELAIALKSREIQTDVPIELLILSACQTALGDDRAGLGLAGLAVRSGARSTIASLWSVSDASTSELMSDLYSRLQQFGQDNAQKSVNRSQILREAQLSLLHSTDYAHPYYWAPFILIGNWQ